MEHTQKHLARKNDMASPFIYGNTVRMLHHGGPWREDEFRPVNYEHYRPQIPGCPVKTRFKPRQLEIYPGQFVTEPDPSVSNIRWTGQLIKHMKQAGFSIEEVQEHLENQDHVGGSFYRWYVVADPGFLKRYYEGSYEPKNKTLKQTTQNTPRSLKTDKKDIGNTRTPGGVVLPISPGRKSKRSQDLWITTEDGFEIRRLDAWKLLNWLIEHPHALQSEIRAQSGVPQRIVRTVLKALVEHGLVAEDSRKQKIGLGRKRVTSRYTASYLGKLYITSSPSDQRWSDGVPEQFLGTKKSEYPSRTHKNASRSASEGFGVGFLDFLIDAPPRGVPLTGSC